MLNESIPTDSASTASSTVLRMTWSPSSCRPDSSTVMGANVSNPNSNSCVDIVDQRLSARAPRLGSLGEHGLVVGRVLSLARRGDALQHGHRDNERRRDQPRPDVEGKVVAAGQ